MNAVAAGASSRRLRAEPDGDAVEAVDKSRDLVLGDAVFLHDLGPGMAAGAGVGNVLTEDRRFFVLGRRDPVLAVAVDTEGRVDVAGQSLLSVDALFVVVEDELVAPAAGLGLLGHEMRFPDPLDIMDAVAVGANRGILDEPLFEKRLSVDALHVFLIGHLAVDMVLDDYCHVLMTGGAGLGYVLPVDGRVGVRKGPDVVLAVAVPALGHFPDAPFEISPSMDAVRVGERVEAGFRFVVFAMARRGTVG